MRAALRNVYLFGGSAGWLADELLVLRSGDCTQFASRATCLGDSVRVAARRCVWLGSARGCLAEEDASLSASELSATLLNASYVSHMCALSASSALAGSLLVLSNWSAAAPIPLALLAGLSTASGSSSSSSSSVCSNARSCAACAAIASADCWWCESLQLCVHSDAWPNALDLLAACPTHSWSRDTSVCSSESRMLKLILLSVETLTISEARVTTYCTLTRTARILSMLDVRTTYSV